MLRKVSRVTKNLMFLPFLSEDKFLRVVYQLFGEI